MCIPCIVAVLMFTNERPVKITNAQALLSYFPDASLFDPSRFDVNVTASEAVEDISA